MKRVIKIGGSLADTADTVLSAIDKSKIPALIIPGGGVFADTVRAARQDEDTSHWQAISAMNRYGVFLSTFGYPVTETLSVPENGISILLPEKILRKRDPLPHSWDVTSDSISLWAAQELRIPLILVKSRSGDSSDTEYIDPYFSRLMQKQPIGYMAVNGRNPAELADIFRHTEEKTVR